MRRKRQCVYALSVRIHERVGTNIERVGVAIEFCKHRLDVLGAAHIEDGDFDAERAGRRLNIARLQEHERAIHVGENGQPSKARNNLAQQIESLADDIVSLNRQTSDVAARMREACDQSDGDGIAH